MNREEALGLKNGDVVYVADSSHKKIIVNGNYIYGEFITYCENGEENMISWRNITK